MTAVRVEVTRGGRVESAHAVDAVAVDGSGRTVLTAGSPQEAVFARSAIKAFQALPLVEDGVVERFGLTSEELALCCASHSGEARHVDAARSILSRIGLGEESLACGPHAPFHGEAARALARAGEEPGRIHNNCSGKHAGMLALAVAHGWETEGYQQADHPVQRRMLAEVARWTGLAESEIPVAVDGCGVATFAVPLTALATAFARLLAAAGADPDGGPARVVGAMAEHPFMVAGTNRLCTALMEATGGRILAKVGAEGVYVAGDRDAGVGVAVKARDGARRAAEVALLAVLEDRGLLDAGSRALDRWARPRIRNTRGEDVGSVRAVLDREPVHG
jgi:L-asparaginase II